MFEDAELRARTFTSYERIAVVTDSAFVRRLVKGFGWLMPGEVRTFPIADLATATSWIQS